jgi:hypothetical protein
MAAFGIATDVTEVGYVQWQNVASDVQDHLRVNG